jgi:hypothetical protein
LLFEGDAMLLWHLQLTKTSQQDLSLLQYSMPPVEAIPFKPSFVLHMSGRQDGSS